MITGKIRRFTNSSSNNRSNFSLNQGLNNKPRGELRVYVKQQSMGLSQ